MTFKILTDDMKKIIHHSNMHSACDPCSSNQWMDPINDEPPQVIKSFHSLSASLPHGEDSTDSMMVEGEIDNVSHHMSVVCANDLVGHTFLMDPREAVQCHHAHIMEFIQDHEHNLKSSDDDHKFRISLSTMICTRKL
jgi:hypothetical protein